MKLRKEGGSILVAKDQVNRLTVQKRHINGRVKLISLYWVRCKPATPFYYF